MDYDKQHTWDEITEHIVARSKAENDKDFKAWVASKEGVGYNFGYRLWRTAYNVHQALNKDYDYFSVIVGKEGVGKSTLGVKWCTIISPTFRVDQICFSMPDFLKALQVAKPGDSFLLDEGALFLFSREAMSDTNRQMMKIFTIMRAKNIHICICIPNFFVLDSYVRDHRVDLLLYVTDRGKVMGYTPSAIKRISKEGAKYKNIKGVKCPDGSFFHSDFNGKFPTQNDINEESYKKHKMTNVDRFINEMSEQAQERVVEKKYLSTNEAAKILGVQSETVRLQLVSGGLPGKKIGNKWLVEKSVIMPGGSRKGVGGDD